MSILRDVLGDDAKLTTEAAQLINIIASRTVARKKQEEAILRQVRNSWSTREKRERPVYLSSKYANGNGKRTQLKRNDGCGSSADVIRSELSKHEVTVEEQTFCDELLRACGDNDQAAIIQHKAVLRQGIPNALAVHISGRLCMELQQQFEDTAGRSAVDFLTILNYIKVAKSLASEEVPERAQVMLSVVLMFVILFNEKQKDIQNSFAVKTAAAQTLLSLPFVKSRGVTLIPFNELSDSDCDHSTALGILILISEWGMPAVGKLLFKHPEVLQSLQSRFSTTSNVYLNCVIFKLIKYLSDLKHFSQLSKLQDLHGPNLLLCPEALNGPPPKLSHLNSSDSNKRESELRHIPPLPVGTSSKVTAGRKEIIHLFEINITSAEVSTAVGD